MSREAHVRICEGVGVRFPHATRLQRSALLTFCYAQVLGSLIDSWKKPV